LLVTSVAEMIEKARNYLRTVGSGLTRQQISDDLFRQFKELRAALIPILLTRWVWEQMRLLKGDDGLSLFGVFAREKEIAVTAERAPVVREEDWKESYYLEQGRRYKHSIDALQRKFDALAARYQKRFKKPLQLDLFEKPRPD
jgi:hypothetical protein